MTNEEATKELIEEWEIFIDGCGLRGIEEKEAKRNPDFKKVYEANLMAIQALEKEPKWITVSERLPTKEEYIANNGLFIVSDGNRTYAEYFDVYDSMKYFGEPTMNGFSVDRCVIAWMPLPEPFKAERSNKE